MLVFRDASFDTIFHTGDGSYYVFKGSNYWKLTEDSVEPGYPRKISEDWPGLPNNIDAAVTWTDNQKTYFFKGSQYWKFDNMEPVDGYPRDISVGFEGIPNNIDAAFVWGGNGKIYFFKNDEYWKFDPSRKPPVKSDYPRDISNWDLPNNIDGAVQWTNRRTYFFKNGQYYRFNDRRFTIDSADPDFPRDAGPWWFGCPDSESQEEEPDYPSILSSSDDAFQLQSETRPFFLLGLHKKTEDTIAQIFDTVGDELLDVIAPDE